MAHAAFATCVSALAASFSFKEFLKFKRICLHVLQQPVVSEVGLVSLERHSTLKEEVLVTYPQPLQRSMNGKLHPALGVRR